MRWEKEEGKEGGTLRANCFVSAIRLDSEKRCFGGGEFGKIAQGIFSYFSHTCYHRSFEITRGGEWLRMK